ncbi:MAG: hypothetical protein A2004_05855 [Spirochaetes bacterium GWC1_61_12]|nr:MAG: hypothetical protein A2004_05855 [Spirochaetes bacterium GWC1_61_12]
MPCGGCTRLLPDPAFAQKNLSLLSLGWIKELQAINRTDRYIDLGSCVSLNGVLALPNIPALDPLKKALLTIGSASIRNRATLGGNICGRDSFGSAFPALSAMEATVELRSAAGTQWLSIHDLVGQDNLPAIPAGSFLDRVRVPLRDWEHNCIVRKGPGLLPGDTNITLTIVANIEKDAISEIHIVLTGRQLVRNRALEMRLTGKKLPLPAKESENCHHDFLESAVEAGLPAGQAIAVADSVRAFLVDLSGGAS